MAGELVEIKVDDVKLRKVERMLRGFPKAVPKVMSRGINRTITSAKTETARKIAAEISLKVSDVKKTIYIKKASYSRWLAQLGISGSRIPLKMFKARQTKKGVSYKIGAKRKFIKSAFFATMSSGHIGVFKRLGKFRLPIAELFGPSLGIVFEESGTIANDVTGSAYKMLGKNIDDQVQLVLKRMKGAAA